MIYDLPQKKFGNRKNARRKNNLAKMIVQDIKNPFKIRSIFKPTKINWIEYKRKNYSNRDKSL